MEIRCQSRLLEEILGLHPLQNRTHLQHRHRLHHRRVPDEQHRATVVRQALVVCPGEGHKMELQASAPQSCQRQMGRRLRSAKLPMRLLHHRDNVHMKPKMFNVKVKGLQVPDSQSHSIRPSPKMMLLAANGLRLLTRSRADHIGIIAEPWKHDGKGPGQPASDLANRRQMGPGNKRLKQTRSWERTCLTSRRLRRWHASRRSC
mmetsp:Transcript_60374/g.143897  ORF Transcript_60374/g.143897 Transcript_60374/m.143897 type:complete len:204 (+) Transcript_60374:1666-2277(+)